MIRTGDEKLISELNDLLGRELGRNERGEPVFSWRWSEDMYWPARDTGVKEIVETKVLTPIIGAPAETHDFLPGAKWNVQDDPYDEDEDEDEEYLCLTCDQREKALVHNVYSIMQDLKPVYTRDSMIPQKCWLMAKWMSPEELILGGLIGHGMGWQGGHKPTQEALVTQWNKLYPGMDFPSKGWRIPTDARLPRSPHDPSEPNLNDTNHFIARVREQTSMGFDARLADMTKWEEERDRKQNIPLYDEIRDGFNAFLNPAPGARGRASGGGFVSFPWSKKDRAR